MLYTKKRYAELAEVSLQYLNEYIKRGKIICTGEKIDDSLPQNEYFLQKRVAKNMPPIELPDIIELLDNEESKIEYDNDGEKRVFELMIDQIKQKKPYPVMHLVFIQPYIAESLRIAYEYALKKEISILRKLNEDVNPQYVRDLIKHYTDRCKSETKKSMKDMKELLQDIIDEYSEEKKF